MLGWYWNWNWNQVWLFFAWPISLLVLSTLYKLIECIYARIAITQQTICIDPELNHSPCGLFFCFGRVASSWPWGINLSHKACLLDWFYWLWVKSARLIAYWIWNPKSRIWIPKGLETLNRMILIQIEFRFDSCYFDWSNWCLES